MKILIVKLSAIGDVVHALPCLPFLRRRFPDAYIAWIVEEKAKDILEGNRYLDDIITINTKRWRKDLLSPTRFIAALKEMRSVFLKIRKIKFDVAIDIQGLAKSGVIGFLSGAKIRAGLHRQNCREIWNIFFTNRKADAEKRDMHVVEKNLAPINVLGIDTEKADKEFFIFIPQRCLDKAAAFLKDMVGKNKKLTGINPGAGWATKLWDPERYAQLADMIIKKHSASILLLWGNEKEKYMVKNIYRMMENKPIISYKSSIKEFCALVKCCDFVIGPDTGPIHIADALGVQTVVLYGPSSGLRNGPYNHGHMCITGRCNELGCYKRKCEKFICMDSITVEEVFKIYDNHSSYGIVERMGGAGETDIAGDNRIIPKKA